MPEAPPPRLRRLAEELDESGLRTDGDDAFRQLLVREIDQALRPAVHEKRAPSGGTIVDPKSDPATWASGAQLDITRGPVDQPLADARRFADGLSSWLVRRTDGTNEWMVFDRPAGSERDLVVLAGVFDATIVQRHPTGSVRVVGRFGVLRRQEFGWHHEPPVHRWIDAVTASSDHGDPQVVEGILRFAVHDLGSRIGALLIYRPDPGPGPPVEERLPTPPPLRIRNALTSLHCDTRFRRSTVLPSSTPKECCAGSASDSCRAVPPRRPWRRFAGRATRQGFATATTTPRPASSR